MEVDGSKISENYQVQFDHGKWAEYAGRTNAEHVCALIGPGGPRRWAILDVGCGDGQIAKALYDNGERWSRYVGVDSFEPALGSFRKLPLPDVELLKRDVLAIGGDFADSSIDLILCLFLLQDLPRSDAEALFAVFRRMLKPGGCAVWSVAVTTQPESFESRGTASALKAIGAPERWRFTWSEAQLVAALKRAGHNPVDERRDPNPFHGTLSELYLRTA